MEVSKILFTKEIKEKMERGLSAREIGRLRWGRLEELYNSGELQKVKNRKELAAAVGFGPQQMDKGYRWVTNLINRKHLEEVSMGVNNGFVENQYFLTGKLPKYKGYSSKNKYQTKPTRRQTTTTKQWIEPPIIERATISKPIKIEITRGDVTITFNDIDLSDNLIKLIATIIKGD